MASPTKRKGIENLQRLGSSLSRRKDQTLSTDLESCPTTPATGVGAGIATRSSFAKDVFSQLLETIKEKRYHVDSEKRVVYTKLMDHLDAVEETHRKSTFSLVLVELLVFSGLLSALVCSLTLERIKHRRFLRLRMWQYIAMGMMIASGLSVVRFLTLAVSWPVKRWWRIHKYVVYFIRQLKRCVDVTLWFCVVLLGWYVWFRPRLRRVHGDLSMVVAHQVTRFLIALCLGSFLWLLKNVLYLKLEADLHYDQLFERVRISVVYLHGLQIIHTSGMWRFLPDSKAKKQLKRLALRKPREIIAPDDEIWIKGENIWMLVKEMDKESVPIWILRRLEEEYLDQVKLHPLPGNSDITKCDQKILREVKKMFRQLVKNQIKGNKWDNYSDLEIKRTDLEGKPYGLKKEELDYIFNPKKHEEEEEEEEEEDDESEAQASKSGTPGERNISYDEFLNWAVRAYKNCWGLERTLNNSKRVFIKLNRLLSTFLLMVVLIIWLLLSGIVNTGQLALLFTPFLAASFIFGDSCRKMFEGLIFAFAMHPFDVGDRVIINNVQMRVTNLNILTSGFHKYDTGEEVIVPNSTLTTTSIVNLDITPDQSDKVEFIIDPQTPLEDIKDLEIKIKKFLDDDIEYSSNNKVVKSEIWKEEMKMIVYFKYLVSYLSAESKAVHKSKILSMIIKFRKNMEIKMKNNSKEPYTSSYQPYIVEIELTRKRKVKLVDIEGIQAETMRGIEERYKPCSKVVITELTKSKVKMGLYVHDSNHTNEDKRLEEKDESESESHDHIENSIPTTWMITENMERLKRNLEHIAETLKTISVVREVRIYQTDKNGQVVKITQANRGWDSLQARDVIQTQDNTEHQEHPAQQAHMARSDPSLATIPSEGVEENRGDHGDLLVLKQVNEAVLENIKNEET